jgi:hypothetical protein
VLRKNKPKKPANMGFEEER